MKVITPDGRGIRKQLLLNGIGSLAPRSPAKPSFGPERQVHRHRVRAAQKPNTVNDLEEVDEAATGAPGEKPRGNFRGVNQCKPDEDDHHRNSCWPRLKTEKNASAERATRSAGSTRSN